MTDAGFRLEQLPPNVRETMRVRRQQRTGGLGRLEAVFDTATRWAPGQIVRVAFLGGTPALHLKIAEVANEIAMQCNLGFDFGYDESQGTLRTWTESDETYAAEIRVSFDLEGYFSLVGTDSIDPAIGYETDNVGGRPHQRSLNLGGFDATLPRSYRRTVLHEFMHAVSFHHEHANVRGPCQDEFRWEDDARYVPTTNEHGVYVADGEGRRPGIYTYLSGPPNGWSRATVDHNLRTVDQQSIRTTAFDPESVMLYRFPALFYRTPNGPCAPIGDGNTLSRLDIIGLQSLYPWPGRGTRTLAASPRSPAVAKRPPPALESRPPRPEPGPPGTLTRQLRARLTRELFTPDDDAAGGFESLPPVPTLPDGTTREAAEALSDENFEAIVVEYGRPSLRFLHDGFEPASDALWAQILAPTVVRDQLNAAGAAVGRVELKGVRDGFVGTAWMIAHDVAITNRHVATVFCARFGDGWQMTRGGGVQIDFGHQGHGLRAEVVEVLYVADEDEVDLALLRLRADGTAPLPPPIPVAKATPSSDSLVATIGFPGDERSTRRHDPATMTRIFDDRYGVKRLAPGKMFRSELPGQPIFSHDCTTLQGSSGSVLIDLATGEAVGLHFSGRARYANYAVIPERVAAKLARVRGDSATVGAALAKTVDGDDEGAPTVEAMADRTGYRADFLGEPHTVPLPELGELAPFAVPVPDADGTAPHELRYHNYSVVMHAERRLALLAAVNIDGGQARRVKRHKDKWYFDPRISPAVQSGNDLYHHNALDRGHLVRRLDPAWGSSQSDAMAAAADTFFWTNCSPQHAQMNQRTWLALEDYLLDHARTEGFKANVFTGPIFADGDPWYRDEWQLPRAYWKVVTMLHTERGALSATAYVVSQAELIEDLEFAYGEFRTYQVPIGFVEGRTGLRFGGPRGTALSQWDPLGRQERAGPRRLDGLEQLVV